MSQIDISKRKLDGLFTVDFSAFRDNRGFLFKYFTPQHFSCIRDDISWRQVIIQQTKHKNTIQGKMFWVCVDLRKGSPTFGQWESMILDADQPRGLYAERGFAHGCCSLEDDSELLILADNDFAQGLGIHYQDPELNIEWPFTEAPIISDAHQDLGSFADFCTEFGGL